MNIRIVLFCLITISIFCSCSSSKISDSEIAKINGTYSAQPISNENVKGLHYNFVSLLSRKLIKDTLRDKPISDYKFELKILNKKHLEISLFDENNKIVNRAKYRYRKKNELIILKNKNTRPILIPYLAGALDVTKLNIKSDDDKNLYVQINQHRSGGAFMIPMGWSNIEQIKKYKRIE